MRESRTYGSGRGACDETRVPTATVRRTRRLGAALVGHGAPSRVRCGKSRGTPPKESSLLVLLLGLNLLLLLDCKPDFLGCSYLICQSQPSLRHVS
jgi:hypothetical protein